MSDTFSPEQRHRVMSRIRAKDTGPERVVRKHLHSAGLRFRLHVRDLPGNPDLVLPKFKTVVFVNGCFWHAHQGCKYFRLPKTNGQYWETKIERNVLRDNYNYVELSRSGWRVIVVWECELRNGKAEERCNRLLREIVRY